MTEQVPARRPRKAPHADALLDAACRIVGSEGLAGLTLRPLAEMLGVSVTVLSTHYGARADVIAAICHAACEQDALLLADWRKMLTALGTPSPPLAADLAEAILEDLATRHRALSLLYLEMLHACSWDASLRPAFAAWAAERNRFWHGFALKAELAPALLDCGWWHGYIIAELAYSVALHGVSSYRMLRRLCLRRLFAGGLAPEPDAEDAVLFGLLLEQMQYAGGAVSTGSARSPEWHALAARTCGIRLAAQGVGGLTHRAIAAEMGIPHTTLSYRFPTQHDLVVAGLESIIAHILSAVDSANLEELQRLRTEGDGQKLDLARANFAVAIATTRMPELASYTANMRSRRGNNLVKVFQKYMPDARGIDALCAQLVSMGLTGLTNTEPPGEASDKSVAAAFSAAAKWLAYSA
ncbi:hypothetical protein ACEN9F_25035 [Duganella sp. CT11-25]|uniref:hypothetical protein n=1 Tax=unclassified Duganella TaxID=2636909 RepID=UPI0039B12543